MYQDPEGLNPKLQNVLEYMLYHVARNDWNTYLTKQIDNKIIDSTELSEMSNYLNSSAVLKIELAEYLDFRGGSGCGDHGHDKAIISASKRVKKVRQALGYSYP